MLRSLLPLVLICLVIVGWTTLRQSADVGVRTVDPIDDRAAGGSAGGYTVLVPTDLGEDYLVTSARTDAGNAGEGDPVTLEIGYLTPAEEYAASSSATTRGPTRWPPSSTAPRSRDTVDIGGETWTGRPPRTTRPRCSARPTG